MTEHGDYYFIEHENMPCMYELSWDCKTPALLIKMHRDFARSISVHQGAPIVESFMKQFQFFSFDCFAKNLCNEQVFGFDSAFVKTGEEEEFVTFSAAIPLVEKLLDEACPDCKGSGKRENFPDEDCMYCMGVGRPGTIDWKPVYAISASFTLFFSWAFMKTNKKDKTSCLFPQLITVETATIKEMHGGSLSGSYSVPLVGFLSSIQPDTEITEMREAMVAAWRKMFRKVNEYEARYAFYGRVAYKNGWLNVSCPGDACGLHPANNMGGPQLGHGYGFTCHNVDNPMQQIALLSGLAALCDKAKREITRC